MRRLGLVAVLALLWFPLTYIAFVVVFTLLQLVIAQATAATVALPLALLIGTASVVGVGRTLDRQLQRR
jgi:hypothetical protein